MTSFCDEVKIRIKGGDGGKGIVSFRREKYVAKGGPDGGDGGRGGNVQLRVNLNINTLSAFRRQAVFSANHGKSGGPKQIHGKSGEDLILDVPEGTVAIDDATGEKIADLVHKEDVAVVALGGRGGFGNAHFTSSTRQTPAFAEKGEPGKERIIRLELKLVADVAIIGLPSVGKSTLISRISNAKPKIADYPFTTLIPNLGVVEVDNYDFLVADIPGLIEGAHRGKGLGDAFLRHTQRTHVIVHMLDVTSTTIQKDYETIQRELTLYDPELAQKPQILVLNKIDALGSELVPEMQKEVEKELGKKVFPLSCVSGDGISSMLYALVDMLRTHKAKAAELIANPPVPETTETYKIFRPHLGRSDRSFRVERKNGVCTVTGTRIEQIVVMTNFNNPEALERVYDVMRKMGIQKELLKLGCAEGEIVRIGDAEILFTISR